MTKDNLIIKKENKVAIITFNRPDSLNALTREMLDNLVHILKKLDMDSDVRAVVLTGSGRAFCAGGDVKSMASGRDDGVPLEQRTLDLRNRMEVSRLLYELSKPTIAMISGPAAGAGMSIALACDLRIASENARLVTAFSNVALSGDFGGSWFLTKLVGPAKAKELYFLSEPILAPEALSLGLFNRVVSEVDLEKITFLLAKQIANGPSVALSYMKKNLNAANSQSLNLSLDLEAIHHASSSMTKDHQEATKSFVSKTKPKFIGK